MRLNQEKTLPAEVLHKLWKERTEWVTFVRSLSFNKQFERHHVHNMIYLLTGFVLIDCNNKFSYKKKQSALLCTSKKYEQVDRNTN